MERKKKVVIAAGGTGGHIYPAEALARELIKQDPHIEILFVSGGLSRNPYFNRDAFPFKDIACGSLVKKNPIHILKNSYKMMQGLYSSFKILRRYRPDLVIGFGSYHSLPPLIAAKMLSIPIILHEANSIPGKVNRLLSPYVLMTGVHFPQASSLLKGRTVEVGMPLREEHLKEVCSREKALAYYNLGLDKKTILVFGGSQGAQALNKAIPETLFKHKNPLLSNFQVIHITGYLRTTEELKKFYQEKGITACVKDFENHMEYAWRAADIMISRAGASTIAEQIQFEVPGILIPYPHASDDHQNFNADYVCKQIGGAKKLLEEHLTLDRLAQEIALVDLHSVSLKQKFQQYKKTVKREEFSTLLINMLHHLAPHEA
jgi:UDP-N-acetylglucosamine--N-acetylmuramyl-(pentapeptide) pyrophosphoryl-undecaprenol N-acetylglucosamine transferase